MTRLIASEWKALTCAASLAILLSAPRLAKATEPYYEAEISSVQHQREYFLIVSKLQLEAMHRFDFRWRSVAARLGQLKMRIAQSSMVSAPEKSGQEKHVEKHIWAARQKARLDSLLFEVTLAKAQIQLDLDDVATALVTGGFGAESPLAQIHASKRAEAEQALAAIHGELTSRKNQAQQTLSGLEADVEAEILKHASMRDLRLQERLAVFAELGHFTVAFKRLETHFNSKLFTGDLETARNLLLCFRWLLAITPNYFSQKLLGDPIRRQRYEDLLIYQRKHLAKMEKSLWEKEKVGALTLGGSNGSRKSGLAQMVTFRGGFLVNVRDVSETAEGGGASSKSESGTNSDRKLPTPEGRSETSKKEPVRDFKEVRTSPTSGVAIEFQSSAGKGNTDLNREPVEFGKAALEGLKSQLDRMSERTLGEHFAFDYPGHAPPISERLGKPNGEPSADPSDLGQRTGRIHDMVDRVRGQPGLPENKKAGLDRLAAEIERYQAAQAAYGAKLGSMVANALKGPLEATAAWKDVSDAVKGLETPEASFGISPEALAELGRQADEAAKGVLEIGINVLGGQPYAVADLVHSLAFDQSILGDPSTTEDKAISALGVALPYVAGTIMKPIAKAMASPKNRAAYQRYLMDLRKVMEKPHVQDAKLRNYVNDLWKPSAEFGNGSTQAAIRYERTTGLPVKGIFHTPKGNRYLKSLKDWLENKPNASASDRAVAEGLIKDLEDALQGPLE